MLEQRIEAELESAAKKKEDEIQKGNEAFQGEQEYAIRKRNREELHKEIDDQFERREHRLKHAVKSKDTSMQWDLVAAAVETTVIKVFKPEGKDAGKMKGRSRIYFQQENKKVT